MEVLALPDWSRSAELPALAAAADALVLQVHGLERVGPGGAPVVFEAGAAARAAAAYGELGRPFELALPVHRWTLADGPGWTRAQADPGALAGQLAAWRAAPPEGLRGLCWFRLPVAGDRGTWPAAALARLRAGEVPEGVVSVEIVDEGGGALTLQATAGGELPSPLPELRLVGAGLEPGDAFRGGRWSAEAGGLRWAPLAGDELWPGERAPLGWARGPGPARVEVLGAPAAGAAGPDPR